LGEVPFDQLEPSFLLLGEGAVGFDLHHGLVDPLLRGEQFAARGRMAYDGDDVRQFFMVCATKVFLREFVHQVVVKGDVGSKTT